jgi:uncharacterized membrane protein YhaH (DUF805 family)
VKRYLEWGRLASRSEYWAVLIISWVLAAVVAIVGTVMMVADGLFMVTGILLIILGLILVIWAMLATTASRCRDAGINPWWTLATMLPYIGFVVMIVVGCLATKSPSNNESLA